MRVGIDFGGVIVRAADEAYGMEFTGGRGLEQPGAFAAVAELVALAEGNVWIVSKASPATQAATRKWLGETRFHQETGFLPGNLLFCAKRNEKAEICRTLALTHFIDDRADVLTLLDGVVSNLYQFGSDAYSTWAAMLAAIHSRHPN